MGHTTYSHVAILAIVSLGGLILGAEVSSMAVFIGSPQFLKYFENPGSLTQGLIAGSNPAGAFIGCFISGFISDKLGRLVTFRTASTIWVLGSIVSILVVNIFMVILGRAIKGTAVGVFSSSLTLYVTEVLPLKRKGLATSVTQWSLTWGIMIMFYIAYLCSFIENDLSFRIAWGLELIPGLALFILSFFIPESPKWLVYKSRWKEANIISRKLRHSEVELYPEPQISDEQKEGSKEKPEEELKNENELEDNFRETRTALDLHENRHQKCGYFDLFRKDLKKHLLVGVGTQVFTQLSGIGVLMYYLVFICEMVGLKDNVKILSSSIQYVINVIFTIFPILWIDSLRRKDVLVYGTTSLGVCILIIGIVMAQCGRKSNISDNESIGWLVDGFAGSLSLALCFLFVAIFASSLSCAAWLYTNEILPVRAKAKGSAICMSVSWAVNFGLTFLTPIALKYIHVYTFIAFGVCGIIGAFVIGFLFPETYGKNEDEIQNIFKLPIDSNTSNGTTGRPVDEINEIEANPDSLNGRNEIKDGYKSLEREKRRGIMLQNNDSTVTNIDQDHKTIKNFKNDQTNLSLPPSQLRYYHHDIIQPSNSPSTNSNLHSGHHHHHNNNQRAADNMSPFLKKNRGPFETDSDLISAQQDIEGTGEDESTTYTDGLINNYYYEESSSPFARSGKKLFK